MERLTTGSPEVDAILGGGVPKDAICLLSGSPGTGKTVLALQMLSANSGPDRKGLCLTTLSEPFYKLTRFMQILSFYDEAKLLEEIIFHDLGGGGGHGRKLLADPGEPYGWPVFAGSPIMIGARLRGLLRVHSATGSPG